jgi:hypothetical protein
LLKPAAAGTAAAVKFRQRARDGSDRAISMRNGLAIVVVLAVAAACCGAARATAEYTYKKDEYVVVDRGLAPNEKFSIAAHGKGEGGSEDFHLYLMAEPAHRPLAALPSIDSKSILDSGPSAFYARWAPDSAHVAIMFRADRHILIMVLYALREGEPHQVEGPTLFGAVTKDMAESSDDYDIRSSVSELTWLGPDTFKLKEHRLYDVSTPELARAFGAFGRREAKPHATTIGDNNVRYDWYFVEFAAQAVGVLNGGGQFQVKDLKPGRFEQLR